MKKNLVNIFTAMLMHGFLLFFSTAHALAPDILAPTSSTRQARDTSVPAPTRKMRKNGTRAQRERRMRPLAPRYRVERRPDRQPEYPIARDREFELPEDAPTYAKIRALTKGKASQKISKKGGRYLSKARRLLNIAKHMAAPIRGAQALYQHLLDKYLYNIVDDKIDEFTGKMLADAGLEKTPMGQQFAPMIRTFRTTGVKSIKATIRAFTDARIKNALLATNTRFILPLLSATYGVPLSEISFNGYQRRENQKHALKVGTNADLLKAFRAEFEPTLKLLGLAPKQVTASHFDNHLLPVFDEIVSQSNKKARTTLKEKWYDEKNKSWTATTLPFVSNAAPDKAPLNLLRSNIFQARNKLFFEHFTDKHISINFDTLMEQFRSTLPRGISIERQSREAEKYEKNLLSGFSSVYSSALGSLGVDKKARETFERKHFEAVLKIFADVLRGDAQEVKQPGSPTYKAVQELLALDLPVSSNADYVKKARAQLLTPKGVLKLQRQLSWARQRLLDTFSREVSSWYKDEYGMDYKEAEPLSYALYLKQRLLPKMLVKHFSGKKIPGTDVVITEDNIDQALEKIEEINARVEQGLEVAEKVYSAFKKMYDIYTITIDVGDALAMSLELAHRPDTDNYYSKLAVAVDKYVTSFDKLLGVLDIPVRDIGVGIKTRVAQKAKAHLVQDEVTDTSLVSYVLAELPKEGVTKDPELKPLKKTLATLRYFAQQYHKFNIFFLKLFTKQIDETGESVFVMQKDKLFEIAKEIMRPAVEEKLKDVISRVLTGYLSARLGPTMGTQLAAQISSLFEKKHRDLWRAQFKAMEEGAREQEREEMRAAAARYRQQQREAGGMVAAGAAATF